MVSSALFSSVFEEWETPQAFFEKLDAEFHFNLDPCATDENHTCPKYYTKEQDGLSQDWGGQRVFCNPPYGRKIVDWVRKCHDEAKKGATVVMLIPARTDTAYFHDFIYHKAKEVRFLRGRLHFSGSKNAAPFPSMIVIF